MTSATTKKVGLLWMLLALNLILLATFGPQNYVQCAGGLFKQANKQQPITSSSSSEITEEIICQQPKNCVGISFRGKSPANNNDGEASASTTIAEKNKNEINDFSAVGPPKRSKSILGKLASKVKSTILPEKSYIRLIHRLHKWYWNYKALQQAGLISAEKDAKTVLRDEYVKVDEMLLNEDYYYLRNDDDLIEATAAALDAAGDQSQAAAAVRERRLDVNKVESMDFVYRALSIVVRRLDRQLNEQINQVVDLESPIREKLATDETDQDPIDEGKLATPDAENQHLEEAMERVKRTIITRAKSFVKNEMIAMAKLVAYKGIAMYMTGLDFTNPAVTANVMEPLIFLLGGANTPLSVAYLRDIELRAALKVFNKIYPIHGITNSGNLTDNIVNGMGGIEEDDHLKTE